jgi:hypothetical protein
VLDCTGHPSEGWNLNHTRELTRAFFIKKREKPVIMDFIYEKIPNIILFSFFTILAFVFSIL